MNRENTRKFPKKPNIQEDIRSLSIAQSEHTIDIGL